MTPTLNISRTDLTTTVREAINRAIAGATQRWEGWPGSIQLASDIMHELDRFMCYQPDIPQRGDRITSIVSGGEYLVEFVEPDLKHLWASVADFTPVRFRLESVKVVN